VTRVDRPVTYKLFPGFKASSLELALSLLDGGVLDLLKTGVRDRDLPRDERLGDGESEYLLLRLGGESMIIAFCEHLRCPRQKCLQERAAK